MEKTLVELLSDSRIEIIAADDELVNPMNSRMLASVLDRLRGNRIGGRTRVRERHRDVHGRLTERAVRWYESLKKKA